MTLSCSATPAAPCGGLSIRTRCSGCSSRRPVTGNKATRVIRNTDFVVEDFYAEDWTVLTPECLEMQGSYGYGGDPWQGKKPYPRPADTAPVIDPMYPNAVHGTCPVVPLYEDIRRAFKPARRMSVGHGMIWPLAAEYARRGWAVRRAGWTDHITDPFNQDASLRWIVYHHGLFHLTYLAKSSTATGSAVSRVVRNTDFGVDEFLAADWTVYSPHAAPTYDGWDQQGKEQYPTPVDASPPSYPYPSTSSGGNPPPTGECPSRAAHFPA